MKLCPKCKQWTMDFDEYFGRFRCFNVECSWMPSSASERRIRLLREHKHLKQLGSTEVPELQMKIEAAYDEVNDALIFDFGSEEPAFEFPDNDARIIWNVGRHTGQVSGFVILEPKAFDVSEIQLNITTRMQNLQHGIKGNFGVLGQGKPTRLAIENIAVTLRTRNDVKAPEAGSADHLWDAVKALSSKYLHT